MTATHVMSLHPVHAQNMLDGGKTIEWRRRWPRIVVPGDRLVIYATSPVSAMIGEVVVAGVHRDTPQALWDRHAVAGMVDEGLFRNYMGALDTAVAVEVTRPQRWAQAMALDDLKALTRHSYHPPQTTARIDDQLVERFRQWARWAAVGQGRCAWDTNRQGSTFLDEPDQAWIREHLSSQMGDATDAFWATVQRNARRWPVLGDPVPGEAPAPTEEHSLHLLWINRPGPLDAQGRPPRERAGFLVLRRPAFPCRFDENDEEIGEKAIDAWFVAPWAQGRGWEQHLFAYAMATLETVTPGCWVTPAQAEVAGPLAHAMGWPVQALADGAVRFNPVVTAVPDVQPRRRVR